MLNDVQNIFIFALEKVINFFQVTNSWFCKGHRPWSTPKEVYGLVSITKSNPLSDWLVLRTKKLKVKNVIL